MITHAKRFAGLCRPPIAVFTACSAVTGHLLGPNRSVATGILTAFAVFILAAGASALNQYQERHIDALMERTRRRPLPAHTVTPRQALSFSVTLLALGSAMLLFASGAAACVLGIFGVIWYNGLYTKLKRLTAFAAVPGAVVGMIPPAIGWVSAGGGIPDARLFAVCFLFFIWQVPHFWLQVLDHGEEYERAGLPSLTSRLGKAQIGRITFIWICAASASGLLLPVYGVITSPFLYCLLLPGSALLAVKSFKLLNAGAQAPLPSAAFRIVNGYLAFVMALLSMESFFRLS